MNAANVAIDNVLDEMAKFSIREKEMIMDILERRIKEERRNLIAEDYEKAMKDYSAGRVKTGNVDQLFDSIK